MYFALLDILRFLSALGVMFHHTFLFHYGKLGVYLFFIISGFVIYFSLQKGLKEYIFGRFLRLYPIFWVCATITFVTTLIYNSNVIALKDYLIGLLMFNNGRMDTMIDGSYWTLTFELLFYAYIGTFVWLFGKKKLEWFYIIWLLISFFAFYFKIDQHIVMKLLSIRFAPYFVFGGMLALMYENFSVSGLKIKLLQITTLISAALLPIYISISLRAQKGSITNFTGSFTFDELLVVESFFVVIPAAVYFSQRSFLQSKKFIKLCISLGGITYPLYLLHWKIGNTVISHYTGSYGNITVFSVFFALLLILVSYILSIYDSSLRKKIREKCLSC